MLYIVMLPVKKDNRRNITLISAPNYEEVRRVLNLPKGWVSFVSLTDLELDAVKQSPHHYKTMFLITESY